MTPTEPTLQTVTAKFSLAWNGLKLDASVPVPTGPVRPRALLPMVQNFANTLCAMGEHYAAANGEQVSCKAGCGACCRQLVPVAETEARHLRDLIEAMPEPRRSAIRQRFADAATRLAEAGLLDRLRDPAGAAKTPEIALEYFDLGIPCPFLEDESCSIHPDRPLSCREFLVSSPPERCRTPRLPGVERVVTPGFALTAFARLDGPTADGKGVRWVPLTLAPAWADAHPEPPAAERGTDLFAAFMKTMTVYKKPVLDAGHDDVTAPEPTP